MKLRNQEQKTVMFGENESAIFRRLTEPGSPKVITLTDALAFVNRPISHNSLAHTLSFLTWKGVLERVGKGVYLNKSTDTMPNITEVIPWVFRNLPYYVGLNAAANRWGLTPQIPNSYQVIYAQNNEATSRRISRWSNMLENIGNLGGTIRPIKCKAPSGLEIGTTQTLLDGSQVLLSTVERTILDSVIYTEEIGGAGEALSWTRVAFASNTIALDEFSRLLDLIGKQINSATVRMGFLLDTLTDENLVDEEQAKRIRNLSNAIKERSLSDSVYMWGNEFDKTEYSDKWQLRVSKDYLKQLNSVTTFE